MIWTRDQAHVINTNGNVYSDVDQILYFWIPKGFDPAEFMVHLGKSGTQECYFSISLLRANIFFKTEFLGFDKGGLKFRMPFKVFKVQRRKDLRFEIPDGYVLRLNYRDPLYPEKQLHRKILDLSASGMAILCEKTEQNVYLPGTPIKDILFTLRDRKIICDGEVRYAKMIPPNQRHSGLKVGIKLDRLRPGDAELIETYVMEESRKFFVRFV